VGGFVDEFADASDIHAAALRRLSNSDSDSSDMPPELPPRTPSRTILTTPTLVSIGPQPSLTTGETTNGGVARSSRAVSLVGSDSVWGANMFQPTSALTWPAGMATRTILVIYVPLLVWDRNDRGSNPCQTNLLCTPSSKGDLIYLVPTLDDFD